MLVVPTRALASIVEVPVGAVAVRGAVAGRERQPRRLGRQHADVLEQARGLTGTQAGDDLDAMVFQLDCPRVTTGRPIE